MHFTTSAHLAAQQCMQLSSTQIFKLPCAVELHEIKAHFVNYLRTSAEEYAERSCSESMSKDR